MWRLLASERRAAGGLSASCEVLQAKSEIADRQAEKEAAIAAGNSTKASEGALGLWGPFHAIPWNIFSSAPCGMPYTGAEYTMRPRI